MAKVPRTSSPTVPKSSPPPEYLAMAAAQMQNLGKLGPQPDPNTLPQVASPPSG